MKQIVIKIFSAIFQWGETLLCRMHIMRPTVIFYVDGGICSQMSQYINGQYYADVADVYYDVRWFERNGKDLDGRFDRALEIQTVFPENSLNTISSRRIRFYMIFYKNINISKNGYLPLPNTISHSVYFGGWWNMRAEDEKRLFERFYRNTKRVQIPYHIERSLLRTNCAIHVRRGDLANREDQWYKKVPTEYFYHAIDYVLDHYQNVRFFLFSDELEWVEQNLCPYISKHEYRLMKGNKAYEDLLLISECDVIIASQGSFGGYGARLSGKAELIKYMSKEGSVNDQLYPTTWIN